MQRERAPFSDKTDMLRKQTLKAQSLCVLMSLAAICGKRVASLSGTCRTARMPYWGRLPVAVGFSAACVCDAVAASGGDIWARKMMRVNGARARQSWAMRKAALPLCGQCGDLAAVTARVL
jgi:hypothetical protein